MECYLHGKEIEISNSNSKVKFFVKAKETLILIK